MKRHIPNAITSCNLISGCLATGAAFAGDLPTAFLLIILGAVFDFFDGFTARLLHVSSPIGKELDSLADVITFGFAPATIVHTLLLEHLPSDVQFLAYAAFLIAAFSALRLAKFNLDERQSHGFIGLPTPANALFWGALALQLTNADLPAALTDGTLGYILLALVPLSAWILVSEVPMFALKFKHFRYQGNAVRYLFILLSALLLVLLGWSGFSAIIILYIIISIITQRTATTTHADHHKD